MNTNDTLPEPLLEKLSRFVEARAGLHFPPERWHDLERGLRATARELGFPDAVHCAHALLLPHAKKDHVALLLARLTVGETYFFREMKAFEALERKVLPELIHARRKTGRRLRIWSAGCCTGEEAYSIAIVLSRVLPDLAEWDITILGTDINAQFLQKAAAGIYSQWSFRGVPEEMKTLYFHPTRDGHFEILPRIRKMVTFECVNLVEDAYPSLLSNTNAMDVIFCRNVLMYFSREQAANVAASLHRSLLSDGWLFCAGSEGVRDVFGHFTPANLPGIVAYRKSAATPRETAPVPAAPWVPREMPAPSITFHSIAAHPPVATVPPVASAELARQFADEGRLAEALAACDRAIAAEKVAPAHHYLRGLILQEQGARAEAAAALRRALYLDHTFVLAHFALGNLMRHEGRHRDAGRCFKNARALLRSYASDAVLADCEGMTAGRLRAILDAIQEVHA